MVTNISRAFEISKVDIVGFACIDLQLTTLGSCLCKYKFLYTLMTILGECSQIIRGVMTISCTPDWDLRCFNP